MDAQRSRELLEAERARLVQVRGGLDEPDAESGAELSALDQHQADVGSEVFEHEKDVSIRDRVDAELREVTYALERLERGSYGTCQTCGAPIGDDRLAAVPATPYCVEHEGLWEGTQMTAPVPEGLYVDEEPSADDLAAWEGAMHLEFLPTEDEVEEVLELGPEEQALHVTGPARGSTDALTPDEVELAELREAELEDEDRRAAQAQESAERAATGAAALEDAQLDG